MAEVGTSPLARGWLQAASILGLDVDAPSSVTLPSGDSVTADVLVRDFGAPAGMLIVRRYDEIRLRTSEVLSAGFGFSVMDDPRPTEAFDIETYVEVLRDWGWSGAPGGEPAWLRSD